ncbi:LAME_0D00584g1_1 [Lachancea meyersii CBS 8951]|uniref:Serine/threonine-protein kinase BUR1 n=1 Tax=Lachancea meyersii CBS 8951 TaxID=1266667 RepID=A0A1G4J5Y7_9SACH|nr:LAME_0D00584g1_1 [Lachancea meyersii CBS 8951]
MSVQGDPSKRTDSKYKIGKVKQTPSVLKDERTGLDYIELKLRQNEHVYGCTVFQNHYKEDKKLGQGTFGEVYRGVHLETQRQVAMKRTIVKAEKDLFPITAQREITILRKLNHKNVIKLIEMVYDYPPSNSSNGANGPSMTSTSQPRSFYMILPYMVADMSGILHNPRIKLEMGAVKNILLQVFEGVNYIHCQKYMHRDIKTANLLIDHKGVLKIADFGLARSYYGAPPNLRFPGGAGVDAKYTSVVVTRWYRAPELVLGDKNYTTAVDMWGIGCVFGEIFEKKPILQGQTDVDQGHVIFKLLGTPNQEQWPLAHYLPGAELTRTTYTSSLRERFGPYLNDSGLDLLSQLLCLDPYKRLTAMAAKNHPFFQEEPLPDAVLKLPCEECHEADIKRYKQEQNRSMSQQPPPAPQGHVVEKPASLTPQVQKLPRGTIGQKGQHTSPVAGGSFNPIKRSGPRQSQQPGGPAPRHPKNFGQPEPPRGSRYGRPPQSSTGAFRGGATGRGESRFNNSASRNRFHNNQRGLPSAPAAVVDQQRAIHDDRAVSGPSKPDVYSTNSRYARNGIASRDRDRDERVHDGLSSQSDASGGNNPNEMPLGRNGKNKPFLRQQATANEAKSGDTHTKHSNESEQQPAHPRQTRQSYKSAREDIADLY